MNTLHSDLVTQLVDPSNASLSAGSNVSVQWRCPDDPRHIWSAAPNTRKRSPRCPVCLNRVILAGINDLTTTHPDVAAQLADPADAQYTHAGSHTKLTWRCDTVAHHQWQASVVSRVRLRSGCPYCSGRIPEPGVNDLATTHPDLATQLVDPTQAITVSAGSGKKLTWQCTTDPLHTWDAPARHRIGTKTKPPTGCPHCANRPARAAQRHPSLRNVQHPLLSTAVDLTAAGRLSTGSGKVVEWHCENPVCGTPHTFYMEVRKRLGGQQCPVSSGKVVLPGVNDLATTHPDIAATLVEQHLATQLSKGSAKTPTWQCAKGHTWQAPVYARVAGNYCPTCNPVGSSYVEQHMIQVLQSLDAGFQERQRIDGTEYDALHDHHAVEFNGLYWHSEATGRGRSYHRTKARHALNTGRTFTTVWEDDWANPIRRAILVRQFAHILYAQDHLATAFDVADIGHLYDPATHRRYGARTLSVGTISNTAAAAFYDQHHIQGATALTAAYALFDDTGTPRAVLGLRSARHNARSRRKPGQWEIQRYATYGTVPGGFTKLLAYAQHDLEHRGTPVQQWVTLSHDESSTGALYAAAGFTVDGAVPASYWYAGGNHRALRVNKESYQLKRFASDPELIYQQGWTEREAATANGLYRIWDCGKTRWIKDVT